MPMVCENDLCKKKKIIKKHRLCGVSNGLIYVLNYLIGNYFGKVIKLIFIIHIFFLM